MSIKKLKIYYLLVYEGRTEFIIFAYLTTKKFKKLFEESNIKFSNKVEIIKDGCQIVSQGDLGGVGNIGDFKVKYDLIKNRYSDQKLFFILDKDIGDSLKIGAVIKKGGDIVQFTEHNSEYLLLKFTGKNLKKHSDFKNIVEFNNYIDSEFQKQFRKKASNLQDLDLDLIFKDVSDEEIMSSFSELFSTTKN